MLKLFYKSFFVGVLCGSLMLMDFSYKGLMINAASAESVKTDKINDSDLMGTLTMTVVGTLASRLYTYKPTTDIMLAAAGGAAFLGGEVLAYFKLKDVMAGMEIQITRDSKGNINKEQIESLERLKKSYQEAKKTAETKKTIQMAAAAAFAAAGLMAYTMSGVETAQLTACTSTIPPVIAAAQASLVSCAALTVGAAACAVPYNACITAATPLSGAITSYELQKQATGPSSAHLSSYTSANSALAAQVGTTAGACSLSGGSAISGACNTKLSTDVLDASGGTGMATAFAMNNPIIKSLIKENNSTTLVATSPLVIQSSISRLFSTTVDFFFPKANAALLSAMGIASSAAVTYLLYTQKSLGPTIDFYMLIPQQRAIVWGVLAGLTFAATSATNNVIKQIDANISKINAILNSMYQMADGATGTQLAQSQPKIQTTLKPNSNVQFNENDYSEVDLTKNGGEPLPCFTGADAKNCKSFDDSIKNTPEYLGLNIESQKQLQSVLSTANGFNGTSKIGSATLKGAGTLGGSANALRAALDRAEKKSAADLKNAGSKFSIGDGTNKLSNSIEKAMTDGLKKSNTTAAGMYASMYGGKGAISSSTASSTDAKKAEEAAAAAAAAEAARRAAAAAKAGKVIDIGSSGSGEKNDLGLGLTPATKELSAEELAKLNADEKAVAGKSIDDYDLKNDITKDKSTSLFELISNRYQQSGYPRLFKRKEVKEIDETPAPVKK
ncbi:MAG: hypothetical protein H7177_03880 [Rhizobacter sp.]|nr:hypothetical protein [Bacteriovorax sp.]